MCSVILTWRVCDGWPEKRQKIVRRKGIILALGIQDSFIHVKYFPLMQFCGFHSKCAGFLLRVRKEKWEQLWAISGASQGRREAFSVVWEFQHAFLCVQEIHLHSSSGRRANFLSSLNTFHSSVTAREPNTHASLSWLTNSLSPSTRIYTYFLCPPGKPFCVAQGHALPYDSPCHTVPLFEGF